MLKQKKYFFALFFLLFFSYHSKAQKFEVDTIQYQGTTKNMVNIVILGDGYTQEELPKFVLDGRRFKDYFFSQHPFSRYKNFFNVFLVKVISLESGAKHTNNADDCPKGDVHDSVKVSGNKLSTKVPMPVANPNNYFGSSFDNNGLHRLVVSKNQTGIRQVLEDNTPSYSQALILVNSPYYGGSGGVFPTATTNIASNDIAIHELGHSFANLADEYWPGLQFLSRDANRSQSANAVPWEKWIGTQGIGIYSYGGASPRSSWYRPHEFCKMQYLVAPFCAVCSEAIIEKIYTIVNPIVKTLPDADKVLNADSLKLFRVKLAAPDPNTLKIDWILNGSTIATQIDSIRLDPGILNVGRNTLEMKVTDATEYVRNDAKVYNTSWIIDLPKEIELKNPILRWGDTIQTCYNNGALITIKQPQAGITYNWYAKKKAKRPMTSGVNFISSKLNKDETYYVEGSFGKKKTKRIEAVVKVLKEINTPEISIEKSDIDGTIVLSVINPDSTINYKWYQNENDVKPISFFSRNGQTAKFNVNRDGTSLKIPASEKGLVFYVEASSKTSTCSSRRKSVLLTL